MASYFVQKFTYDGGDSLCFGQFDKHNHDVANQFTIDIKAYLEGLGLRNVDARDFESGQNRPAEGKEFRWNGTHWLHV